MIRNITEIEDEPKRITNSQVNTYVTGFTLNIIVFLKI